MTPPENINDNLWYLKKGEVIEGIDAGNNKVVKIEGYEVFRTTPGEDGNPIIQLGGKMIIGKKEDFELETTTENAMGTRKEGNFASNMTIEEKRAMEMEEEFDPDNLPESTLKDFLVSLHESPGPIIEGLMENPEELLNNNDDLSSSDKTLILNSLSEFHESGSTDIIHFIRKAIEQSAE